MARTTIVQELGAELDISLIGQMTGEFAFADLLSVGVYFCGRDGSLLSFNRECGTLWGRSPGASPGGPFGRGCTVYLPDGKLLALSDDPMAVVLASGMAVEGRELIFERSDGSRIFVEVSAKPIFEGGILAGGVGCIQDISRRKAAEVRLQDAQERLAAVIDAMPKSIAILAGDGQLLQINAAGREMLGACGAEGLEGRLFQNVVAEENREQWHAHHERVCGGETLTWSFDIVGAAGERRPVEIQGVPIRLCDGDFGQFAIMRDLAEVHSDEMNAVRLAAIVTSSDDAIVSKTLEGFITSWNAGAERIFGYSAEEMIGQHITRIVPVELRSEEEEILARLRRGEHVDHFETVRIAKDGRQIDVSVTVSPMRDKSGKLFGASKVGRDISERKRAERLQRLLVSELNHRVKNTLAAVQSIANQTARRAKSTDEFALSFSGRLQGLAQTHNLLTQSSWQGAELSEMVRDHLPRGDERISCSGPAVMLNAQTALHLGLVLHELATNAMKYGALSTDQGHLTVQWRLEADDSRHLVLLWKERGGPEVKVPETVGFGTLLIERSLDAHGGVISINYAVEGLTCEIKLPLPETAAGEREAHSALSSSAFEPRRPLNEQNGDPERGTLADQSPPVATDISASLETIGSQAVDPAGDVQKS